MLDTTSPATVRITASLSQARLIRRLRETLFELQCEPDPDPAAIDRLMRRLARVRSRDAHSPAHG
ncbi:hypothetical protein [Pseudorhodoferax sp. Leaf274]|uniref:hypothetical protein n=1 Tax=Pseudorhodoferax sp. Leaf274 TaxID=1736318 RepID=UPI0007032EB9|nr:hypothetical protein [Pseudorhodoferax sp. Leaf274]KQP49639.1 hypothetical protein ASF44_03345 [Pseudorhodoferax sp. Leaf274]